jgi:hypothetical protein
MAQIDPVKGFITHAAPTRASVQRILLRQKKWKQKIFERKRKQKITA